MQVHELIDALESLPRDAKLEISVVAPRNQVFANDDVWPGLILLGVKEDYGILKIATPPDFPPVAYLSFYQN